MLTSVLPSLSRTPSDDEMLSTDPEVESPGGSVDDLNLHREVRTPSPRQNRAQSLQYSKSESLVVDGFNNSRLRLSPTLRIPGNKRKSATQNSTVIKLYLIFSQQPRLFFKT